jgi:metal-sulfur cluster biosynthetic enzyme
MTKDEVMEALREVIDPEIGVNIVDLGLVYAVGVNEGDVWVATTMTTPACPLHSFITAQIEAVIWQRFPDVTSVDVELVWDPPWNPDMISPELKRAMGRAG